MSHRWGLVRLALGFVACASVAPCAHAQGEHRGILRQNDPNPFSHHTTIPFRVGEESCAPGTERHVVTLRIYNILSQVVAFAALPDSGSKGPRQIMNLALACGTYVALWNGTRSPNGREAPPGVYMYQLLIDGHPAGMRKMVLSR